MLRIRPTRTGRGRRYPALAVAGLAVLLAVSAGTVALLRAAGPDHKRLTAYFDNSVGVYPQSHVRVLGVTVGRVTGVKPVGEAVRVDMVYDADRKIPADARAVILSPSLASDRYVQLSPVYRGGPALPDKATLPLSRTAVPVEFDELLASVDELVTALGPGGANADGELSELLRVGAENLEGQGDDLRATTAHLSDAAATLGDSRADLFATVRNLQSFTTALADADRQARSFNEDLAQVSTQLDAESEEIAAALRNLSVALEQVTGFVRANRDEITGNIEDLTTVSRVLVRQRDTLAELLDTFPLTASNAWLTYDPVSASLATRMNAQQIQNPAMFMCSLLYSVGMPPSECEELLAPLNLLAREAPPGGLDPTVLPFLAARPDMQPPPPEARGDRSARRPASESGSSPDPTLGGVLAPGGRR